MTVIELAEVTRTKPPGRPRVMTFYSPVHRGDDGQDRSLSISLRIEDGDIARVLHIVRKNGGIGQENAEGVLQYVPWPCAAVTIRDA
ncbi:MAG TPA: hypothetical protein VJR58_18495 [Vineibacter sp.]|nr:hypothetical protein [Vineibacter sp.]